MEVSHNDLIPAMAKMEHLPAEWSGNGRQVFVQEKIDGSQFSWGPRNGELYFRSKNRMLQPDNAGMFQPVVDHLLSRWDSASMGHRRFYEGWTFRGEFLAKPKHNTLTYQEIPDGYVALFEMIDKFGLSTILLGIEVTAEFWGCSPIIADRLRYNEIDVDRLAAKSSMLGGEREGVVIRTSTDNWKFVRPEFREANKSNWKVAHGGRDAVVDSIATSISNERRWDKAFQHLHDDGVLELHPRDIGKLIREVQADVKAEEEQTIKDMLFETYWPHIARRLARGVPEWYKAEKLGLA